MMEILGKPLGFQLVHFRLQWIQQNRIALRQQCVSITVEFFIAFFYATEIFIFNLQILLRNNFVLLTNVPLIYICPYHFLHLQWIRQTCGMHHIYCFANQLNIIIVSASNQFILLHYTTYLCKIQVLFNFDELRSLVYSFIVFFFKIIKRLNRVLSIYFLKL